MLNEEQVKNECIKFITDSKRSTAARDQMDRGRLNQDFFRGGKHQWTEEEWEIYKSKGVEPVTINRSKPVIKGLLGMYLQNRQDIKVRPRRNGTHTVARVWTEILKHTQDLSYADYVYASVFLRGAIDTESYLKLEIDRAENINGQPKIVGKNLSEIIVDRNAIEYDLNESAKYVIEKQWKDKDELAAMYPDQEDDIKAGIASLDEDSITDRMANNIASYMSDESALYSDDDEDDMITDNELLERYRYLTHKCYWKEIVPAVAVGDTKTGMMKTITDEKKIKNIRRKAKKSNRYIVTNHVAKILHETVMLGDQILEDTINPYGEGISDFPIVRFSPMWDEGYACGALDDVVSLNKEENIHRTQTIRMINQTANSGWIVGTDNNKEYISLLKDFGSVEGIVIPRDKFGNTIEKIQPNVPSPGHYSMSQQFEQDVKRVSGIDDATQGYNVGRVESGVAIGKKLHQNRMSNEPFFDSFYRTLEVFGNFLLKVIIKNDFYTDKEIMSIVGESGLMDAKMLEKSHNQLVAKLRVDLPQPQMLPPLDPELIKQVRPEDQQMVLQTVQQGMDAARRYQQAYPRLKASWDDVIKQQAINMLLKELRNDENGMYGVKVTVSANSPTERIARLAELEVVQDKYGIIPPDIFIDATDLANKDDIKARMQQAQQAQQQALQAQLMAQQSPPAQMMAPQAQPVPQGAGAA